MKWDPGACVPSVTVLDDWVKGLNYYKVWQRVALKLYLKDIHNADNIFVLNLTVIYDCYTDGTVVPVDLMTADC